MKTMLFVFLFVASAIAQQPKPPVGVPADAKFFNGKWYQVYVEEVKTWGRAKERAKAKGAMLACIHDEGTHNFLATMAKNRTLWVGGSKGADALWYWVDGAALTCAAWGTKQPEGGKDENFLVMSGGKLHDHHGKGGVPIVGFVCEWKAK